MTQAKTRILLIEDDDLLAHFVVNLLEEYADDFQIAHAADLADGMAKLSELQPEVLLLDLNLPDSSGLDTLKTVVASGANTAIIIMTGTNDEAIATSALQHGAQDYLIKGQGSNLLIIKSIRYALERKQFHDQLQLSQSKMLQSEKMASIGQLAAGVAHEINNPMGFITSNLNSLAKYLARLLEFLQLQHTALASHPDQTLLADLADQRRKLKIDLISADIKELIAESLIGSEKVQEIVQGLRSFSRTDQSRHEQANINDIIEDTLKVVWNELKYKTTITKDMGPLPLVHCFPHQLGQVFMNLLVNAAQAIDQQGKITIQTKGTAGQVVIKISDTGCGIAPSKIKQIFDPFFTTKPVGEGTGLGLSIVYDIITHKHGGHIEVTSTVGKGTTFTITLPVEQGDNRD
ncbi:MAG: response regulator [Proteobacteria bacterium]|nr:response regulator [Pseudomonadota bacterium]MBU1640463.1 response regulator [Pseudomonadota bacterium]